MSYVPATTVKDGVTLNLAGVDWQVTGTDLVGEVLSPSSWQAVATYSGKAYYSAADGYITTAEYVGDITRAGVESVTYTLTYLGTEHTGDEAGSHETGILSSVPDAVLHALPFALGGAGLIAATVLGVLLVRSRRRVKALQAGTEATEVAEDAEDDYEETEEIR